MGTPMKYRNQKKIFADYSSDVVELAEKEFLGITFCSLPIDVQKKILGFYAINPFDGKTDCSKEEQEYRNGLANLGAIELNAEIII